MTAVYKVTRLSGTEHTVLVEGIENEAHGKRVAGYIQANNPIAKSVELVSVEPYVSTFTLNEATNERLLGGR